MQKLFDQFLKKKIDSLELVIRLRLISKYIYNIDGQRKDFCKLIDDIECLNELTKGKERYENILIVFNSYLCNRKKIKDKITSNFKNTLI